jgi:signal transduction histidine kinase
VNEILLTVHDDGHGFDPAVASVKGGLGLISINERARHVNGKASVTSTPGEGATVKVQIPLAQES